MKNGSYQPQLDEKVLSWKSKKAAKEFALSKCGKYKWKYKPTVFEIKEY